MHVAGGDLPAGFEQQLTGRRAAAADHDLIGVEGVDRVGDADSERVRPAAHRCERRRVAVPAAATASAPSTGLPGRTHLPSAESGCSTAAAGRSDRVRAGGQRLERSRLREVVARGRHVGIARRARSASFPSSPAPPLPPRKMRPSITTPAADTRADRDHHEVARDEASDPHRAPPQAPRRSRRCRRTPARRAARRAPCAAARPSAGCWSRRRSHRSQSARSTARRCRRPHTDRPPAASPTISTSWSISASRAVERGRLLACAPPCPSGPEQRRGDLGAADVDPDDRSS